MQHAETYGVSKLVWADQAGSMIDAITHEKRLKRRRREWKFALIEAGNPDWDDLYDRFNA